MQYTFVFLGTMDVYTPDDNYLKEYLGGDPTIKLQQTISALGHYIQEDLKPTPNPLFEGRLSSIFSDVHFVPNKPVVVMDGPDIFGTSVYEKITRGVLLSVNAILRGARTLDYLGFSRGSVIAQHVCEEIARIKGAVQTAKGEDWTVTNMTNLICDTDKLSTRSKSVYSTYLQRSLTADHIQILRDSFCSDAQFCNLLKFDPVPGGCEGSSVNPWVWTSPRHYTRPSVVKHCVVVAQEDEFSSGFTLSIPEFSEIWHVPGCHPNTNGNPLGHDPKDAYVRKFPYEKTRDVQTWAFYKALQFVEAHGARLVAESSGRYLDSLYPKYRAATDSVQQACLMYDVYQKIIENISFYRQFRESSYKQFYVVGYAPESIQDERRVMGYLDQEHPRPLSDYIHFDVNNPARQMVNIDHWFCAFAKLGLYDEAFDALSHPQRCVKYVERLLSYFDQAHASMAADCEKILAQIVQLTPELLARYYYSHSLSAEDVFAVQTVMTRLAQEQRVPSQLKTDLTTALIQEYCRLLTRMNQPVEVDLSSTEQFLKHAEIHYDGLDHLVTRLKQLNDNGFKDNLYHYRIRLMDIQTKFVEACENVLYRNDFHILPIKDSKFCDALRAYREQRYQGGSRTQNSPGPRTPGIRTPVHTTPSRSQFFADDASLRQRLFGLQTEHLLLETRMNTATMLTQQLTPPRGADNIGETQQLQRLLKANEVGQTEFKISGTNNLVRQRRLSGVVAAHAAIEEHGNPYYFSGSIYQFIGGVAMVLGLIVAAVALTCLILGYASLWAASSAVVIGGGVAALGLFGLHKGTQIEGEQLVFSSVIPMPSPAENR